MNRLEKLNDNNSRIVIALDGPSASGKGHIGKELATRFNLQYVESSLVYRSLAYLCLQKGIDEKQVMQITKLAATDVLEAIAGADLKTEEIGLMASKVSALPEVRTALTKGLKEKIAATRRIIMEGRDIGSVVAPNADIKIFITASVEVRAERRYNQLLASEQLHASEKKYELKKIYEALVERDNLDTSRKVAPLRSMPDAIIVDTTNLSPYEVIEYILTRI